MNQPDQLEIRELQQQVKWLTRTVIFLSVVLAINAGLLPLALGSFFGFLLLLPVLVFTHHLIPAAARFMGRIFSFMTYGNRHAS